MFASEGIIRFLIDDFTRTSILQHCITRADKKMKLNFFLQAASFFLFYSYYNQALFVLSAMAFLCSIFLGIAPFVYSSVKK